jgi:predicted Zn-dependent protease
VQRAQTRVSELPAGSLTNKTVNKDGYLKVVQGMVFGENPRNGYFKATTFYHPDMKFMLNFPSGWKSANMPEAVVSQSPDNAAQLQMVLGKGTPAQAVQQFTSQQGITARQSQNTTINGLPAAVATFDAQTESGVLKGQVGAVQHQGQTMIVYGIMTSAAATARSSEIDAAIRSFRVLTDPAALNVQPATVQLITLTEAMTGQTFAQRFPSSVPAETVYIINEMDATTNLPRGAVVKRVVGGALP